MSESEELIKKLQETIKELQETNKKLIIRIQELEDQLNLNSQNSSIPTSKELYKIRKANKKKSDKKVGAQKGRKGLPVVKYEADEVIKVEIGKTCECGGEIKLAEEPYIHQKLDIPPIKPHIIEYHMERGRCKCCNKRISAKLPDNVTPDLLGPNIKAIIVSLTGFSKNSKPEVQSILANIFNVKLSIGTISNTEKRVSEKCKEYYEEIEAEVVNSNLVHMDETSHSSMGKTIWAWVFASKMGTLLKIKNSRGQKVLEQTGFSPEDDTIIVTDRYSSYNFFNPENRQICWAHLKRDFERLSHSSCPEVKEIGIKLKIIASKTFKLRDKVLNNSLGEGNFLRIIKKMAKMQEILLEKLLSIKKIKKISGIAKNLLKHKEMMWKFLEDIEKIPITNNHAEQQIKHFVIYRKNSFFTKSERGERFLERIISLFLTCKKKMINPFTKLHELISGSDLGLLKPGV